MREKRKESSANSGSPMATSWCSCQRWEEFMGSWEIKKIENEKEKKGTEGMK